MTAVRPCTCDDVARCRWCRQAWADPRYRTLYGLDGVTPPASACGVRRVPTAFDPPAPRRVCVSVEMDAYPFQQFPEELPRPCPLKTRRCVLYDEDCTLDPRPADGSQGPVLRDCLGCERRGEGFAPRLPP